MTARPCLAGEFGDCAMVSDPIASTLSPFGLNCVKTTKKGSTGLEGS